MGRKRTIRRSALRVDQHPEHPLYMFTLTGEELLKIADIWHASRNDKGMLEGYQRPQAKRHVRNITAYLDGDAVLFPNPIILALSSKAKFRKSRSKDLGYGNGAPGILEIPVPRKGARKPAWVVDGQQRMMALAKSWRVQELIVPVNAFVTDDDAVQREQFIRVNSSKPLPRGLLTELLPQVAGALPAKLAAKRIPSAICDLLNQDPQSPFFGLIRRASMSRVAKKRTVVTDTPIIKMLEDSLHSPGGALFTYQNMGTGELDVESIRQLLFIYWTAVRDVFPDAWGISAKESRLMHGAGIQAMGRLMDKVMSPMNIYAKDAPAATRREIRKIRPLCRWTGGIWDDLGLRWNDIQNTPSHVRRLSELVVQGYVHA